MKITANAMREWRRGTYLAREVIAKKRMAPRNMHSLMESLPLWETAYHHEMSRAVKDGRIKPPTGGSGASR